MTPIEVDAEPTVIERGDPRLGMRLGDRYRIDVKIASGGFGSVYRAHDTVSRRDVAVKLIHPQLARDPVMTARFQREVTALAQLHDPHTVVAYDAGEAPDGSLYLVMELLEGESLLERFTARGALPWQSVVALARGACSALAEAHGRGIVHRDLKPANIHIERGDFVKVLDFGIAKLRDTPGDDDGITHVGQMIGTFDYMAPEQMAGTCTPASDVFALGIVMYELCAGTRPWVAAGPTSLLAALLSSTPEPLIGVPERLSQVIMRCLEREPGDRYASAAELATALDDLAEPTTEPIARVDRITPPAIDAQMHSTLQGTGVSPFRRNRASSPRLALGTGAGAGTRQALDPPIATTLPASPPPMARASMPLIPTDATPAPARAPTAPPAKSAAWPVFAFIAIAVVVAAAIALGFAAI